MRVYVGIVSYNSVDVLPTCIRAVQAQTYPNIQITVFDNASSDGSAQWVRSAGLPLIENSGNIGFARAHNRILNSCTLDVDDFYMPLNPDVVLSTDYIAIVLDCITSTTAGWAIGKLVLVNNPATLYSAGHGIRRDGYFFNIGYQQPDHGQFSTRKEIFGASGAATLVSARLIADVASHGELFDSAMFLYGEDTDLDWRARRAGWHCWYEPRATATHRGSTPGDELRIQAVANRYLGVLKNAYWVDLITYNFPIIVLHTLLRLIVTPRLGVFLLERIIRQGLPIWRKRRLPRMSRPDFLLWCQTRADTSQPTGWLARLKSFFS